MARLAKFWPVMQGGPLPGIWVHELGAEGETGPACRDCKKILIIFFFHSFFSPLGTPLALCGWTLRRKTIAVTAKTTVRNLMILVGFKLKTLAMRWN